jgi:hypothetical protein
MRGHRKYLVGAAIVAAFAFVSPSAQADHHEVKLAEIFPGGTGTANLEYVELEMVASGQNFFLDTDASITMYGSGTITIALDLQNFDNGQRGRRILVGATGTDITNDVQDAFGVEPDVTFANANILSASSGAVCFSAPQFSTGDCVSWGGFADALPFPTGGNTPPIDTDQTLVRDRPVCGPGLIDTNHPLNWLTDEPDPQNNAGPAAGVPCPETTITKTPKKTTTKRLAKFSFTSTLVGADEFLCKLDNAPFRDCESPFSKRVGVGRHTFKVRGPGDPSPASYSWKVKKRRR